MNAADWSGTRRAICGGGFAAAGWVGLCLNVVAQQAEAAPPALNAMAVTCSVSGYEVLLKNAGSDTWPTGTTIAWSVRFAKMAGTHTIDRPVEPGAIVFLASALGSSYLDPRKKCEARFPEPAEPASPPN